MVATKDHFNNADIMKNLENFTQYEWFTKYGSNGVIPTWLNKYHVPFSLILTQWGLCFNFNMIPSSNLLHINQTSSDFHYNANIVNLAYIPSLDSNALDSNETFPWVAKNNRRHLILYFNDEMYQENNPFVERQGYHLIFHSNFEMPFEDEKNHIRIGSGKFVTVDFSPAVYEADDSLLELNVNE